MWFYYRVENTNAISHLQRNKTPKRDYLFRISILFPKPKHTPVAVASQTGHRSCHNQIIMHLYSKPALVWQITISCYFIQTMTTNDSSRLTDWFRVQPYHVYPCIALVHYSTCRSLSNSIMTLVSILCFVLLHETYSSMKEPDATLIKVFKSIMKKLRPFHPIFMLLWLRFRFQSFKASGIWIILSLSAWSVKCHWHLPKMTLDPSNKISEKTWKIIGFWINSYYFEWPL